MASASRFSRWSRVFAIGLFLALAVALVYGQTLHHEFVNYDDDVYVYKNPHVANGLSPQAIHWAFTKSHAGNWDPLTWISHMLDCQIYGLDPGGHHLTSVVLHAATAILLFLILLRMTGRLWPSALVAVIWAVHPLRVESVAWVAERKDVLSGLFFVLTLGAYVEYARHPFSSTRYLAVLTVYALGLMSKPMLVTLPCVLFLLDYWPLGRMVSIAPQDSRIPICRFWRAQPFPVSMRLLLEKLPLFALAGTSCGLTIWAQREAGGMGFNEHIPLLWRLGNAVVSYVAYLGQLIYPMDLVAFYPHPRSDLAVWKVLAASLVFIGITAGALVARRKHPYSFVGWLWYVGMLLPVIGLLQTGSHARADRFTYLPQIGLLVAVVWGAAHWSRRWPRREWVCGIVGAIVITILISFARAQTVYWRDSETLWKHALNCIPSNAVAHNNLGRVFAEKQRFQEAITSYQEAIAADPKYVEAYNNLGVALKQSGRVADAIRFYRMALALQPRLAGAEDNLGVALALRGQSEEAIVHLRRALEMRPDSVLTLQHLATALDNRGLSCEAIAHYKRAVEMKPDFVEVHGRLAWLLATSDDPACRNGTEAVAHAHELVRLSHRKDPEVLNVLAAAYAELGRFSEAVQAARKGAALAAQQGNAQSARFMRARARDYETRKPYRR